MPTGVAHASSEQFSVVWSELTEILGSAATAMLFRNCIRRASRRGGAVDGVVIARERFEYRYELPAAWSTSAEAAREAVKMLFSELRPLLVELTGPVVVQRLAASEMSEVARAFGAEVTP